MRKISLLKGVVVGMLLKYFGKKASKYIFKEIVLKNGFLKQLVLKIYYIRSDGVVLVLTRSFLYSFS